jgi:hypothetical protein
MPEFNDGNGSEVGEQIAFAILITKRGKACKQRY